MRILGYYWGIAGVILLLSSAVWRLMPRVLELLDIQISQWQWLLLVLFSLFMIYSEGYRGFHLNFAPRVIVRAGRLSARPSVLLVLLAPLACMGFFHATRKRMIVSWTITTCIILLVLGVSRLQQPWRGIVDAGVVLGLTVGILSIVWHWGRQYFQGIAPDIAADLPESA